MKIFLRLELVLRLQKNDKRGIEKELSKTLKAMVKDGSAKKILQKYVPDAEKYLEVNSLER